MIFSAIVLVVILAVLLVQVTQGWFSAMIMAVLTVTCAALALGSYDYVAVNFLAPYWKPNYAHGIALAALFGVPLIILRVVFDKVIRRSAMLPVMFDRIGGGICAFITALTMGGMFALVAISLPFDKGSILGFSRVDVADPSAEKPAGMDQRDLWLKPDRFAAGLGTMLSAGIFSSGESLYQDHPNLVQEAGWTNSVPAGVSRYAAPGSISVAGTELIGEVYRTVPAIDPRNNPPTFEPIEAPAGKEFRLVRVKLGDKAKDERRSHLFTLRQFRLAGHQPGSALMQEFHAIAIEQEQNDPTMHYVRFDKGRADLPVVDKVYAPKGGDTVSVVFEVPKSFQPTHVSYKRGAQAPVSVTEGSSEAPPPARPRRDAGESAAASGSTPPAAPPAASPPPSASAPPPAATASGEQPSGRRPRGGIRGVTNKTGKSFFGDELPVELKAYHGSNIDQSGGRLASGSLVADLGKQAEGTDPPISKLTVPEDQRLLHLSMSRLQAQSGLGRILSQVVTTVENYYVTDAAGNRYVVVGKYAVANVDGTDTLELQYFGGADGGGRMHPFDRIKDSHLKGEYGLVLLFLVNPGAQITGFSSGGDSTRADDLTSENLVAPR